MLLPSTPSSQTLFLPPGNCPLEPSLGQQCVPSSPAPHRAAGGGDKKHGKVVLVAAADKPSSATFPALDP